MGEAQRKYNRSEKGRAVLARAKAKYRASEKGKEHERAYNAMYKASIRGQAANAMASIRRNERRKAI